MINPAMFGVSQEQLKQAQEIGRHVDLEVSLDRRAGSFTATFRPKTDQADPSQIAVKTVESLVQQMYQLFGIHSVVEDVG